MKQFKDLAIVLTIIICIQGLVIHSSGNSQNSFAIFNKSRHTVIGFKNNNSFKAYHNLSNLTNETFISNFIVGEEINEIEEDSLKSIYKIENKLLLLVDSLGVYNTSFKPDIVLLRDSPKINLNRLIDYLEPELIVADGSNYKSYVDRWEATCNTKKLPFHATTKKGALTIDYAIK